MKKRNGNRGALYCAITVLVFSIVLFMSACPGDNKRNTNTSLSTLTGEDNQKEVIVGDFSLTITLDKTEASIGDIITATVVLRNMGTRDIDAEIPDWLVASKRKPIEDFTAEDILVAPFFSGDDFRWVFRDIAVLNRPAILIKGGAVIKRQFEHVVTETGNLEVRAGAFFITPDNAADNYGMQIVSGPLNIFVR